MAIPQKQFDPLEAAIKLGKDSRIDSTGFPSFVRKGDDRRGKDVKSDGGSKTGKDVPPREGP